MVPIQNQMFLPDLLAPLNHQLKYIAEVSLPQLNFIGIHIILLEFSEKQFSWSKIVAVGTWHHDGDVQPLKHLLCTLCSMIWSPWIENKEVKFNERGGVPRSWNLPSHVKIWLLRQWGLILSSLRQSFSTNIPIILLLELLWLRHKYTSPWLETATIMLIRGAIVFWGTEQFLSIGFQCIRRKSDYPNQVSSMFKTTIFLWLISRNLLAYYYLSTRVLSELLLGEIDFNFLYLSP